MNEKLVIPARKYKGESSVVSARLPSEMVKRLDQIADETGRNRNEIIALCLEFAMDNLVTEDKH